MNTVIEKYISNKSILPRFAVLIIDILIILFSCSLTFFLRFDLSELGSQLVPFLINRTLVLIGANIIFFILFKTFSGVLRFSAFTDLLRIVYALTLGYAVAYIFLKFYYVSKINNAIPISEGLFFSTYVINVLIMVFSRITVREVYEMITHQNKGADDVFIYGTKEVGMGIAKAIKGNPQFNYKISGFITDETEMIGKMLIGVKVYENNNQLFRLLSDRNIKT